MSSMALGTTAEVRRNAFRMSNIERFFYLLRHVKSLVRLYGPYTTYSGTSVFTRAPIASESEIVQEPSTKDLALSLAAAQDAIGSAQADEPAKDDLDIFSHLWETTLTILEELLERGNLDQESFGWGIFGLASGYMHPPANNLSARDIFSSHKYRLHSALSVLPSIDSSGRNRSEYVLSEKTKVEALVKARKEMHLCAFLLLQRFRQEEWRRVRWWHAIAVTERWIGRLGLVPESGHEEVKGKVDEGH